MSLQDRTDLFISYQSRIETRDIKGYTVLIFGCEVGLERKGTHMGWYQVMACQFVMHFQPLMERFFTCHMYYLFHHLDSFSFCCHSFYFFERVMLTCFCQQQT